MNQETLEALAKRLRDANSSGEVCEPIRDTLGTEDISSAYAIQNINTSHELQNGGKIIGKKIGLTSPAVQAQLGVNQPDYGMLWQHKEVENGGHISIKDIMQAKAEVEIAFVLGKDLVDQDITTIDIISAIDYALVAIELVGSRIRDWDIKITDTIADNGSASHWVVGHKPVSLSDFDVINCKMTLHKNGVLVSEGFGKNCLNSPINALRWLAVKMVEMGHPIRKGEIIFTGALGPMVHVEAGDHFEACIEGLGHASVTFTP